MEKRCPKCETKKDVSEWYANRAQYDGLSSYCKTCTDQISRERSKTPQGRNQPAKRKRWADGQMRIIKPRGSDY